ncbi:MAG: VanZ family protein [Flavobacteriaceae bacterium]|nr:VanZ family protein [Flavobacteriaceae bacterium]
MSKKRILIILLFVIAAVFYYSWLPDSSFSNETYLPIWLLNWSNHYYNLRTAIPFLAVGFLLEAYTQQMGSYEIDYNANLNFIQNLGIATVIACIAEAGQFLFQNRNPDLKDVFYGILGSIVGGLGYYLVNILLNFNRLKNAK